MRAVVVAALNVLATTGCVSSTAYLTPYPAEWPERSGSTNCRIAGIYRDAGELRAVSGVSPGQRHGHLSWLLREGRPGPFDDAANPELNLSLDRDSPKMSFGPSQETELLRSVGGVICESDGGVTLRFEAVAARAYRHTQVTAWNGADGSLIVRMGLRFTEKGLPFLPSSHEVLWFRFDRVSP